MKSVPSGQTDSVVMSAETSPDGVRRATSCQRYQNHETSVTWSFLELELVQLLLFAIYIYIVFGYSIWPVCAVMSKWALAIFPFTNKSSRVGVEHWPGVIYSIQKYVYILLTLRFIKGCCSRGSNFPISLLCVMCFPHLHPSN